ncbi:MAG: H-X9-DG-CTERM domain-containing protein [Planctomycetota bacterium]
MKTSTRLLFGVVLTTAFIRPQSATARDSLIELIPDNAFTALYIERPQRTLSPTLIKPIFAAVSESDATAATLVEAVKRIPGPILIGLITPPPNGDDAPDVFFAMDLTGPPVDADELMEKAFLPALDLIRSGPQTQPLKLEKGKTSSRVLMGGETLLAYAVKDKVLFGATKPQLPLRWVRGEWPKKQWVKMPGVRRLLGRLPDEFSARLLINPVPLFKFIEKLQPNSPDEVVLKTLAPEDVLAGAIDLTWDRWTLSARATIALVEDCQGVARVLARPTHPARVLGVFPEDFLAVGRIGWKNAAGIFNGLYELTDQFDETISAEYREELAEFEKESGVDWDAGILGNLVGEVAFGVRVDFTRPSPVGWAVVFPLADEAKFREQFDKLAEHFELPFEEVEVEGVRVRKTTMSRIEPAEGVELPAVVSGFPKTFFLAQQHSLLIVGSDAATVADVAKQAAGGLKAEPAGANLRACYNRLGDPNHLAVMLDVEQLRKKVPVIGMAVGPRLAPAVAEGFVGVAVAVEEHVVSAELHWSSRSAGAKPRETQGAEMPAIGTEEVMLELGTAVARSFAQARAQAKRVVSMSNMRGMGQALYIYADKHGGAFPESLEALLRAIPDALSLKMLISPYDGRGPESIDDVERDAYVVYRPGLTTGSIPTEVVMAERTLHDGGANFLFQDGHVEFIEEPHATRLLEMIANGEEHVLWPSE